VYTLYNSQQLTLFSSSEDFGSNSATTAASKQASSSLLLAFASMVKQFENRKTDFD
jgi:hypothetical protein